MLGPMWSSDMVMGLLFLNNGWTRGCLVNRQRKAAHLHPSGLEESSWMWGFCKMNVGWIEGCTCHHGWLFHIAFEVLREDHEFCVIALPDPGSRQLEVVCRYVWSYSAHRLVLMRLFDTIFDDFSKFLYPVVHFLPSTGELKFARNGDSLLVHFSWFLRRESSVGHGELQILVHFFILSSFVPASWVDHSC